jgi:7,8-dihydropterin-6-yl-methyl-4-(beta-D-ribofuranosyl)aminobenzene 5'-phosphate synthase
VCTDGSPAGPPVPVLPAAVLHDIEPPFDIDLEPVDSVVVTTLMDSVADMLLPDQGPARRVSLGSGPRRPSTTMVDELTPSTLIAEHGFSVLVTVAKGGTEHRFLFDTGTSPDGIMRNMHHLDIDPGHFDHTAGLDGLVRSLGQVNMPVLIHPHFWRRRRLVLPGRDPVEIPTTSRRALEEAGFDIIEEQQPSFLFGRSVLITGEVARTTGYEPGFPSQQAWLGGRWAPDPLVLDDQALIVNVSGRGLVVITGCGHAGVVNIARYAQRLCRGEPLYALIGGFHLAGPAFEPLIPRVVAELAEINPAVLVPAHCTGWRAQHALAARFRGAFIPNSVGTSFDLSAPAYGEPDQRKVNPASV